MSSLKVEFVDFELPPPRRGRKADWQLVEFADALRDNPGRWAKYPRPLAPGSTRNRAALINSDSVHRPKVFKDEGFEARTHDGVLFVRYVSEPA